MLTLPAATSTELTLAMPGVCLGRLGRMFHVAVRPLHVRCWLIRSQRRARSYAQENCNPDQRMLISCSPPHSNSLNRIAPGQPHAILVKNCFRCILINPATYVRVPSQAS